MNPILSGLTAVNGLAVSVALRNKASLREYLSKVLRAYRDSVGAGLPCKSPIQFLFETGAAVFRPETRIQFPAILHGGGGTATEELMYLAAVAQVLQPRVVFEIGTFTGLTTSLFILNAAAGARVITVDLPPDEDVSSRGYIGTDADLVRQRKVAHYVSVLGLADRYEQWFCDSTKIDPKPLAGQVDLGFIDGAHALSYVTSDTVNMAKMIRDTGIVLWHDYGGVGEFRPLSEYLEKLGTKAPMWRIERTSLAWCLGADLKKAVAQI